MEADKETTEEEEEEELHGHLSVENLPIMHWEQLSDRIAELELQEEERRERGTGDTRGRHWRDDWEEEEEDFRRRRLSVSSSRSQNHRNLQLCFINDGHSEEEEEEETKACQAPRGARHNGCHGAGLKQEVVSALRALRDQLLSEQKEEEEEEEEEEERKHLDLQDLQLFS
ncbi:uncharacterized protein DDB_G0283697, partial [Austrofundulus limnaeus]|uniref:Uncharacterized protein DDB_G0283697 n=1 Tax=Austrofundulus limnaeus TaxID=52670 RepID=A0A2I4AL72_AUSLI